MALRVAINGFGRIGRNVLRSAKQSQQTGIDFVGINDLADADTLAHLFAYDSVHGRYPGSVPPTWRHPQRRDAAPHFPQHRR